MIKKYILFLATIFLLINVQAINECLEITKPGEYYLEEDIYANCECIIINSSDVKLNGLGNSIKNNLKNYENCYAIKIENKKNISIENLSLYYFGNKICDPIDYNGDDSYGQSLTFYNISQIFIENINLYNGCIGIDIGRSEKVIAKEINSINQSIGIQIINSKGLNIKNIEIKNSNIDAYIEGSNNIKFESFNFSNSLYGIYLIGSNNLFYKGFIKNKIYDTILEEGLNNSFLDVYYDRNKEFVNTYGFSEAEIIRKWSLSIYTNKNNKPEIIMYNNENENIFKEILYKNENKKIEIIEYINSKLPKEYNPYTLRFYKNNKKIYEEIFYINKEKYLFI